MEVENRNTYNPTCPISMGELVDKLSILQIKYIKISENEKKVQVLKESKLLRAILAKYPESPIIDRYFEKLYKLNLKLWELEDKIRLKDKKCEFDEEFIEAAKLIYRTNDQRFKVKNLINENFRSGIREVKSYL